MGLLEVLAADAWGADLPRTLVAVAHPDDETVGAGSRLPRLRDAQFVYVTDGAPRDGRNALRLGLSTAAYRDLRRREREAAFALCGIAPAQVTEFDCTDQQASLQLVRLSQRLAGLLAQQRIEAVLTQPYEGGHPDHDATAFIAHAAVALVQARTGNAPALVEMSSYHNGTAGLTPCAFLPDAQADAFAVTVHLSDDEQQFKRFLVACYASQQDTLRCFPVDTECFRPAPRYDFRQAPHTGLLFYETHEWGMTGRRFRELAAAALVDLGLRGAL